MLARARRLDLLGPLRAALAAEGSGLEAQLMAAHHRHAVAAWDIPRIHSALRWWEGFRLAMPARVPFIPAIGADALIGHIWNRTTLDLFTEFVRAGKPLGKAKGDRLTSETISGYASAIHLLRSREARYDIAPPDANLSGALALRTMRREDGPPGDRALQLGLRAEQIAGAASGGSLGH